MTLLEDLLSRNDRFVSEDFGHKQYHELEGPPTLKLAIVTCMDSRHSATNILGIAPGESIVIRNAGAVVDDGVIRSLLVAIHALGVNTILLLPHTDCGMKRVGTGDRVVAHGIADRTDVPLHEVIGPDFQHWLAGFKDMQDHIRDGLEQLRMHPMIPKDVTILGGHYDNHSGKVVPYAEDA